MGRWMFSALPVAGSTAILLFAIRGSTIADDIFASAVRALHGDRDHQTFYFFQDFCFYSITAFSFCPLPEQRTRLCAQLRMHPRTPIDLPVLVKDVMDLFGQFAIFSLVGARLALTPFIVAAHTYSQRAAQRRDRVLLAVLGYERIP